MRHRPILALAAAALLSACSAAPPEVAASVHPAILTFARQVDRVSTVPAIKGKHAALAIRERVAAPLVAADGGKLSDDKAVLFVNGGPWPAAVAFDLRYRDYSWMRFLAASGYDVFAMDRTGYGASSRPKMDDPCNVDPKAQAALVPKPLKAACKPHYPFRLVSSDSDDADIDAVVDYIRKLRGVEAVTLIGWSDGGRDIGVYAARHPYKVDKLILLAPSNYDRSAPPKALPAPGFPTRFLTRAAAEDRPWQANAKCPGEIDDGIRDAVWTQALASDPVGAGWGSGGLRAPTGSYWGWDEDEAAHIRIPTLVMVGADDPLAKSDRALYDDLGTPAKVLLTLQCASHYSMWESQHATLQKASLEWLDIGTVSGVRIGRLRAAPNGTIAADKPAAKPDAKPK